MCAFTLHIYLLYSSLGIWMRDKLTKAVEMHRSHRCFETIRKELHHASVNCVKLALAASAEPEQLKWLASLQAYKRCFHVVVRPLRRLCSKEGFLCCSARDRATVGGSVHRHAGELPQTCCDLAPSIKFADTESWAQRDNSPPMSRPAFNFVGASKSTLLQKQRRTNQIPKLNLYQTLTLKFND